MTEAVSLPAPDGANPRVHVAVVGLMGVGKTTIADLLATRLDRPHRDSDRDIEALVGVTGRDISVTSGIDVLHRYEEAVCLGALAAPCPSIVSVAGWAVESDLCRRALSRRAFVVWLQLAPEVAAARATSGLHRRTIDSAEQAAIAVRRGPLLTATADAVVDALATPSAIVEAIVARLSAAA